MDEVVSEDEASLSLSEEAPWGGLVGSSFTGNPGRYVEKVSGYGHLRGGPFPVEGNLVCGGGGPCIPGTLVDERRRALVLVHLSAKDSIRGTLGEGFFTGEPVR